MKCGWPVGILFVLTSPSFAFDHDPNHLVVRIASEADATEVFDGLALKEIEMLVAPPFNLFLLRSSEGFAQIEPLVRSHPDVIYTQKDHFITSRQVKEVVPDDKEYKHQWNLKKIKANKAWSLGTGGKDRGGDTIAVAVIDEGVMLRHRDLTSNLWSNAGEIPDNNKDDDANGYVDDINGWNAYAKNGEIPVSSHGTHVAGIIGARGDNELDVSGVNWEIDLIPIAGVSRRFSTVARAYGYVIHQKKAWIESKGKIGANIVATNSSFGVDFAKCSSGDFPGWNDLYNEMGRHGILSAVATMNRAEDVDVKGDVPTSCESHYIIAVTNTDKADKLYKKAAWGRTHIDLGAPGVSILSTETGRFETAYKTGTSMATPHVAGAIAFLHSVASEDFYRDYLEDPAKTSLKLKSILLETIDPVEALKDKTVSKGRLNLLRSAIAVSEYSSVKKSLNLLSWFEI